MVETQKTNEHSISTQEIVHYAIDLIKRGHNNLFIQEALMKKGLNEYTANMVIQKVSRVHIAMNSDEVLKSILYGVLWIVGGVAVIVFSYSNTSPKGLFVLACGAIAFGVFKFVKGLINMK